MRICFDPEHEIPKLQTWFAENNHPSRLQVEEYVAILNSLESRKGKKPLDINNVIYWFKNTRYIFYNYYNELLFNDSTIEQQWKEPKWRMTGICWNLFISRNCPKSMKGLTGLFDYLIEISFSTICRGFPRWFQHLRNVIPASTATVNTGIHQNCDCFKVIFCI